MKRSSSKSLIALLLAVFLLATYGLDRDPQAGPPVAAGLALVKAIVTAAAWVGLDQAGESLVGAGWRYIRVVLNPILERFPDLLKTGTDEAKRAAEEAWYALDHDPRLRAEVENRLIKLEAEQALVREKLNLFEAVHEDLDRRLRRLEARAGIPPKEDPALQAQFTPFVDALETFLSEAPGGFQGLRGALMSKGVWHDSRVYLRGAQCCRVPATTERDHAFCIMFSSEITGAGYTALGRKRASLAEAMAENVYEEMSLKVRQALPASWKVTEENIDEKPAQIRAREGWVFYPIPGKVRVLTLSSDAPSRRVEVRLRRWRFAGHAQFRVEIRIY